MEVSKYISIPKTRSSNSNESYLHYIEILISLSTGILLICFTIINQYVVTQSQLQIAYLFGLIIIVKAVIPINYMLKRKKQLTHLKQQSKIHIKSLFVPSFIKSLLYFGLMILILYLGWFIILLPVIICIFGVEFLWCYVIHKKQYVVKKLNQGNQIWKKDKKNWCRCITVQEIMVQVLLIISLLLHVEMFDLDCNVHTILLICFSGSLCLLAFFYLHHQIFQLYNSDVDQILAKQYLIELFNFLLSYGIFVFSSYIELGKIEQIFSFNFPYMDTMQTNNINQNNDELQISPRFNFIIQYPIHTIICIVFSILHEYLCYEMIKKNSFKKVFLTQLTGIFWFNLFYFKQNTSTQLYFSTIISLLSLIILIEFINIQKIIKIKKFCLLFFQKKFNRHFNNKIVQEGDK